MMMIVITTTIIVVIIIIIISSRRSSKARLQLIIFFTQRKNLCLTNTLLQLDKDKTELVREHMLYFICDSS